MPHMTFDTQRKLLPYLTSAFKCSAQGVLTAVSGHKCLDSL